MFDLVVSSIGYIKSGRLRPLGVTSAGRIDLLPDVPPLADVIPGFETQGWYGLGAPADTPAEIIDKLNTELNAALADARTGPLVAALANRTTLSRTLRLAPPSNPPASGR